MQLPLFEPKSVWSAPDSLPDWQNADMLVIDTETYDPGLTDRGSGWARGEGHIAGYAVGLVYGEALQATYLPVAHQHGGNLSRRHVTNWLNEATSSQIPKLFFNALYDMGWMQREGLTIRGPIHDAAAAAALLDENRMSYSLDNLAMDYCGMGKDEKLLHEAAAAYGFTNKTVKANMWRMPPRYVGPYAEQDAVATHALWKVLEPLLYENNLTGVYQLEMDLVPMLIEMRMRGVRVDMDQAEIVKKEIHKKYKSLLKKIKDRTGVHVNIWAADSLAPAFDAEGISYPLTDKTHKPSFTKEWLESNGSELAADVLRARRYQKVIGTFIEGMIQGSSVNGRIHTELNPLKSDDGGTVSGRFSSRNPNLQQVSARDPELGPLVRSLFLPEEDTLWGALDYSAQEPRLTLHYAYITNQLGAADAVAQYHRDPRTDYHQMVADICGIERKPAKTINLGLAYGMGGAKLCHGLGLPTIWMVRVGREWLPVDTEEGQAAVARGARPIELAGEEGQEILKRYHAGAPFIQGLMDTCANKARDRGWIRTIGGRLCRFDLFEPTGGRGTPLPHKKALERYGSGIKRAFTHKALNRLIQGSAADMMKKAMLLCYQEGILPMLTMHDELDLPIAEEREWRKAEQCMVEAVKLEVPVVVDCEFGKNWGDAVHPWSEAA